MVNISVIIPCFNCQNTIERAIKSVLTQDYMPIELILVNNNSTDLTGKILEKFEWMYHPFIVVKNQVKQGSCASRNLGLQFATGDWIQFLDSDDLILPSKLAHQASLVQQYTDIDLIIGGSNRVSISKQNGTIKYNKNKLLIDAAKGLILNQFGNTCSNLWRKNALLNVNGWKEDLPGLDETLLMENLIKNGSKYVFDPQIHTSIFYTPSSLSRPINWEKKMNLMTFIFSQMNRMAIEADMVQKSNKHFKLSQHAIAKEWLSEKWYYIPLYQADFHKIKSDFKIKVSMATFLQTYHHYIISNYVSSDSFIKYFQYIANYFIRWLQLR